MSLSLKLFTMRKYNITKYKNNTHFTVNVTDSFGQKHGNFFRTTEECNKYVHEVWENEVDNRDEEMDSLNRAIKWCVDNSPRFTDNMGNHRD